VDCGTSGGVLGLERGYCLMIGGEPDVVRSLDPIFAPSRPAPATHRARPAASNGRGTAEAGYLHCGRTGAGHFGKDVCTTASSMA